MKDEAIFFYSWQSNDNDTRNYVENSIKGVINDLVKEPDLEIPPRMDRDVQGEVGAVDIAKVIHEKIAACDVFIGDVSIVDTSRSDRFLVNQNVMYEVGYAMGKLSEKKIVLVANTDLADPKLLPFDINGKLVIPFSPKTDPKRIEFKKKLKEVFSIHLDLISEQRKEETGKELVYKLTQAVENNRPCRIKAEKYFDYIYKCLNDMSAGRYNGKVELDEYAKETYEAYTSTKNITVEIVELLEIAGEHNNEQVMITAFQKLELMTRYFDIVPEDDGRMYGQSTEYQELIAYEITQAIFGVMIKNGMQKSFSKIAQIEHYRPMLAKNRKALETICRSPSMVGAYFDKMKNLKYYSPTTAIYQERWNDSIDIQKTLISGGLLLYLVRTDHYPFSMGLLLMEDWERYAPDFLNDLKSRKFVSNLLAISEQNEYENLRELIYARATHQIDIRYRFGSLKHLFDKFGIKSIDDVGPQSQIVQVI